MGNARLCETARRSFFCASPRLFQFLKCETELFEFSKFEPEIFRTDFSFIGELVYEKGVKSHKNVRVCFPGRDLIAGLCAWHARAALVDCICRPKGPLLSGSRYFRVAVTLGWLKNVCGIALPTSGERDDEINLSGLENYTIGHSSDVE